MNIMYLVTMDMAAMAASPKGLAATFKATAAALARQDRLLLGYFGNGFCSLITDGDSEILEVARQGVLLLEQHYGDYVKVKDLRTRRDSHA